MPNFSPCNPSISSNIRGVGGKLEEIDGLQGLKLGIEDQDVGLDAFEVGGDEAGIRVDDDAIGKIGPDGAPGGDLAVEPAHGRWNEIGDHQLRLGGGQIINEERRIHTAHAVAAQVGGFDNKGVFGAQAGLIQVKLLAQDFDTARSEE